MKQATNEIKDRLKCYTRLLREIENQEERLELMRLETPGGKLTEAKKARLREALDANLAEEQRQNAELENLLKMLDDPDERAVIRLRYFDRRDWESVTAAIYGASVGYCDDPASYKNRVYKLHGNALLKLAAALTEVIGSNRK